MTLKNLIGTDKDQVSRNRDLGTLAYTNPNNVAITGGVVKNSTFNIIEYKDPYQNTDRISVLPTLKLDFLKNSQIDPRFTFARNSTATYIGKDGLIKTAAVNEPRFEYDPFTHNCNGLLIEEQKTNYFLQSEDFNTTWTKILLTSVTTNQVASPDGQVTADKIIPNTTSGDHYIGQTISYTSGVTYTMSVYAKPAGYNRIQLFFASSRFNATGRRALFDVSTGTIIATETGVTSTITNVGNGWYRCSISAPATSTGTGASGISVLSSTETVIGNNWAADGTNGVYLWGGQSENGAGMTSYIPTTTVAVTRIYDSFYTTDMSWLNLTEGTSIVNAQLLFNSGSDAIYSISEPTVQNNYQYVYYYISTDGLRFDVQVSNTTQCAMTRTKTLNVKSAFATKANDYAISLNGDTVTTDSSGTMPTIVTKLVFGMSANESNLSTMYLKQFTYYPKRLPNAMLQELSK